jgi:hypothetical protein
MAAMVAKAVTVVQVPALVVDLNKGAVVARHKAVQIDPAASLMVVPQQDRGQDKRGALWEWADSREKVRLHLHKGRVDLPSAFRMAMDWDTSPPSPGKVRNRLRRLTRISGNSPRRGGVMCRRIDIAFK